MGLGLYSTVGRALNLLPWFGLLAGDLNQPKMPTSFPGQTSSPVQLCRRTELLAGTFTCRPLQGGIRSAKIWALVAVSPVPLLHLNLICSGQALQILPMIPMKQDPNGPARKNPTILMELSILLGLSFSHWINCRLKGPSWWGAVLTCGKGQRNQTIVIPLTLYDGPFSESVVQGYASTSSCILRFSQLYLVCGSWC